MTFTHSLSTNNYGTAKFIVSSNIYEGTHTTIGAALTSASSGDTIFIRPGTYTEDLTLKSGITISAYASNRITVYQTPSVTIIGKAIDNGVAVNVTFYGMRIQTNSDFVCSLTAASAVTYHNCTINATNNTPFNMTNGGANIFMYESSGDLGTTGIALTSQTHGDLWLYNSSFSNSGVSTTLTTCSDGSIAAYNSQLNVPLGTSGTGLINLTNCQFGSNITPFINQTWVTTTGTGTSHLINACEFYSGTSSAISIGVNTIAAISKSLVNSSNTNAITGGGAINYSDITFTGTSSLINTTTQTANYTNLGKYKATGQPCFLATMTTAVTNAWGDGGSYTVVYNNSVFDQNSNYATGTGVFTAPVAGKYLFTTTTSLSNTGGTAAANASIFLIATSRALSAGGTAYITTDPNGFITLQGCWIVDMAVGDTAKLVVNGSTTASTKTGTFYGAAGTAFTWFSGVQIA